MKYQLVREIPSELPSLVSLDIETTRRGDLDSDPFIDPILSIQISDGDRVWVLTEPDTFRSVVPLLERPDVTKVIHNAGFDLLFLMQQLGAKPAKRSIHDSLLTERVFHTGKSYMEHNLGEVLARQVGVLLDKSRQKTIGKSQELSQEDLEYAANDVIHLPKLYEKQMKDVNALQLGRVVGLENRLTVAFARMRLFGVCFDRELWKEYKPRIENELNNIKLQMADYLGLSRRQSLFDDRIDVGVNFDSVPQMKRIFERLNIEVDSTGEESLTEFLHKNPKHPHAAFVELFLEGWRNWGMYLKANYLKDIHPVTGRIHPEWNQLRAKTGRSACSHPNLQNVHRPEDDRPNYRLLFVPPEGYLFLDCDFSQQEPRCLAQQSGDELLRQACLEADVYSALGKIVYGKEIKKGDPERQAMKVYVLAIFYGLAPETPELQELQRVIFQRFPKAAAFANRMIAMARANGYVRTQYGRILHFEEAKGLRNIGGHLANQIRNAPVQGSGGDLLKIGLDKFDDVVIERNYDACQVMVVHDEMLVAGREDIAEEVYYQAVGCLEEAGRELCPDVLMPAAGKISPKWEH